MFENTRFASANAEQITLNVFGNIWTHFIVTSALMVISLCIVVSVGLSVWWIHALTPILAAMVVAMPPLRKVIYGSSYPYDTWLGIMLVTGLSLFAWYVAIRVAGRQ